MSSLGSWPRARDVFSGETEETREPGARRKRLAGYLRAANELRQTYQQSYRDSWANRNGQSDSTDEIPGAFPSTAMAGGGTEELVIFPSYARRHIHRKREKMPTPPSTLGGDSEYWKEQWETYEDEHAIVDVDVRGWIYTPQRGPLTRKNRLLVGLARQLSGVAAPSSGSPQRSATGSRTSSPVGLNRRLETHDARHEERLAAREAASIVRKGEVEAELAHQGAYSEHPDDNIGEQYTTTDSFQPRTRVPSFDRTGQLRDFSPPSRSASSVMDPPRSNVEMSPNELGIANKHLMERLQPFLATPLISVPISTFFYNETRSTQKSIESDGSGHFSLRAALDFVPTHVRILASENLSVNEPVRITESGGVSIISDIDDTIKHSAINSGAKEIFKNVFVRDFHELLIDGVQRWYSELEKLGCTFHYVSNSPWQLYPLLKAFFVTAKLPSGSFHLKQYTGMLQGIFEPVAERKKHALDTLMADFPERRFLLIGDSGEADLEVYTDVVCEYPGRILGVFIRDITTSTRYGFFDPAWGPLAEENNRNLAPWPSTGLPARPPVRAVQTIDPGGVPSVRDAMTRSFQDVSISRSNDTSLRHWKNSKDKGIDDTSRPPLPPRKPSAPAVPEGNLINLDEESGPTTESADHHPHLKELGPELSKPPPKPNKPKNLASHLHVPSVARGATGRMPPPIPPKPSGFGNNLPRCPETGQASSSRKIETMSASPQSGSHDSQRHQAKDILTSEYSAFAKPDFSSRPHEQRSSPAAKLPIAAKPPPVPPRKPAPSMNKTRTSSPSAVASSDWENSFNPGSQNNNLVGRKEEAWKRRWSRAKEVLEERGVVLRAWRVGEDASTDAINLVKRAIQ